MKPKLLLSLALWSAKDYICRRIVATRIAYYRAFPTRPNQFREYLLVSSIEELIKDGFVLFTDQGKTLMQVPSHIYIYIPDEYPIFQKNPLCWDGPKPFLRSIHKPYDHNGILPYAITCPKKTKYERDYFIKK